MKENWVTVKYIVESLLKNVDQEANDSLKQRNEEKQSENSANGHVEETAEWTSLTRHNSSI